MSKSNYPPGVTGMEEQINPSQPRERPPSDADRIADLETRVRKLRSRLADAEALALSFLTQLRDKSDPVVARRAVRDVQRVMGGQPLAALEQIAALEAEAAPGPWYTVESPWRELHDGYPTHGTYAVAGDRDPHIGEAVLDTLDVLEWETPDHHAAQIAQADANLGFAVACVNWVRRLLKGER